MENKKAQINDKFLDKISEKSVFLSDMDGTVTRADHIFSTDVRNSLKEGFNQIAKKDPRATELFNRTQERLSEIGYTFDIDKPIGNSTTFVPFLQSVKEMYPELQSYYEEKLLGDHFHTLNKDEDFIKGYQSISDSFYKRIIYTNAPISYNTKILEALGLDAEQVEDFTSDAHDCYHGTGINSFKPRKESFALLLEELKEEGISAEDIVFFEDKIENIETAASFGVMCVQVNSTGKMLTPEEQAKLDKLEVPSVTSYGLALQEIGSARKIKVTQPVMQI